ncbi:MAG: HSP90 family protein [Oscillospiraceae bacterium]|nr:HSP90 family protein [Oscillospiraceae bacterium]
MDEFIFNVNLEGMMDLLSNHLYSTPKVFLRELLQNSADAVNLRKTWGMEEEPRIDITVTENKSLVFRDNGSGLTKDEIHKFISVIGKSSKRDSRDSSSFIGRFGIGMLSCFMVTSEIILRSRSAQSPEKVYEWHGYTSGKYTVSEIQSDMPVGTEIIINAGEKYAEWFTLSDIISAVRYYALPLPYPVYVSDGSFTARANPLFNKTSTSDRENVLTMGRHIFGTDFDFIDFIPLESETGLFSGVAYILPFTVSAASVRNHRIYLKNILLTEDGSSILPEWAFFVQCFFNTDRLSANASRENFYRNDLLKTAESEIEHCISSYLERISIQNPALLARIVSIHGNALKSVAAENERLFKIFMPYFNFDSSFGIRSGKTLMHYDYTIFYTTDADTFRQLRPVFCEKDELLVNASQVYIKELICMLDQLSIAHTEAVSESLLDTFLEDPPDADDYDYLCAISSIALEKYDCSVRIKSIIPAQLTSLYTINTDGQLKRDIEKSKQNSDGMFDEMLDAFSEELSADSSSVLYLNAENPLIMKLADIDDPDKIEVCAHIIYIQALIAGGFPVSPPELFIMNENLIKLLEWGL